MTSGDEMWTSDSSAYLRPEPEADAWSQEAAARNGRGSQQLLTVATTEPPGHVARALGLAHAEPAVVRHRLISFNERPVELASSWYPSSLATGTALAEPRKIKGGAVTLLAALGHRIASVTEDVESRLADDFEASTLMLGGHEPVLVLTRTARNQDGEPIEVSVMITPGTERRLRYEMRVD